MVKDADEYSPGILKFKKASELVDARIVECNLRGHLQPTPEENRCEYCFQHLVYQTPRTDAILKQRGESSIDAQPYDAPFIIRTQQDEINAQRSLDRLKGIEELMDMKTPFQ